MKLMLTIWATVSSEVALIEAAFSISDSVTEKVAAVSGASLALSHLCLRLSLSFFMCVKKFNKRSKEGMGRPTKRMARTFPLTFFVFAAAFVKRLRHGTWARGLTSARCTRVDTSLQLSRRRSRSGSARCEQTHSFVYFPAIFLFVRLQ